MMYGRYGADQLFYTLIVLDLVCSVLGTLLRFPLLLLLGDIGLILAILRYFSKNIYKRREENRKFLDLWNACKRFFKRQRDRVRDRKVCRYRKCPKCKSVLRLPIKRGKHSVKCPRCGQSFDVHILF